MSGTVNKMILVGYLGKDPESRRTQDGKLVVSFSLATNESSKDKETGERKQRTDWHRIVCFNENIGKVVEQYLKKGAKVYLEGQSQTRKWTDNGVEKYVTECVIQPFNGSLTMLDSKERVPDADNLDSYGQTDGDEVPPKHLDEEIPF